MTTQPDDGGPAFPMQVTLSPGSEVCYGMTLRDWFAGMAMQGFISSNPKPTSNDPIKVMRDLVSLAYVTADAMIAERNKTK